MDHAAYIELLHLEGDGELTHADQRGLERHLGECASCRTERAALRRLDGALTEIAEPAGAEFRAEVMARLPAAGWEARRPRSWAVAAVVMIALLGGAAALLGPETAAPGTSVTGSLLAAGELLGSATVAGAGLLSASWRGIGAAVSGVLAGSPVHLIGFLLVVLGLDLALLRLLRAPREAPAPRRLR